MNGDDYDDNRGYVVIALAAAALSGGLVGFVTGYTVASVLGMVLLLS